MNLWVRLRTTGAYWALPSIFGVGVWAALTNLGDLTGYAAADYASASYLLPIVGPLVAMFVALRVPPFITVLSNSRPVRRRTLVALGWWAPVWVGAPFSAVLAIVSVTRELPKDGGAVAVLAVVGAAVLACVGWGLLLGRSLPAVVAIPLAAVVPFWWFAFPGSRMEVLPRNLYSGFVGCCTAAERPSTAMVLGSSVLDLVLVGGAVLSVVGAATYARHRITAFGVLIGATAAAAALGTVAAIAAPGPLEFNPSDVRTTQQTCASRMDHQVCAWPENDGGLPRALSILVQFDSSLRQAGLPGVRTTTERPSGDGVVMMSVSPRFSTQLTREYLAEGYMGAATTCNGTRPVRTADLPLILVALIAGVNDEELTQNGYSGSEIAAAKTVLQGSPASVAAWFRLHTCDPGAR